jgi:hypothetical protein
MTTLAATAVLAAAGVAVATTAGATAQPTVPTLPGTALPLPVDGHVGADVPFTEYEAELANTNGAILQASRAYTTLAAEASGRRAVALKAGQYVEFTLARPANAVDVRYSLPEGPDSALHISIDGSGGPDLTLTAAYSHMYGLYPFTKNPADGGEHHFFDEARTLLGRDLAPGTRVRLQATAPTVIDLADFEHVAPAPEAPSGFLSATDFGADPTGKADSGTAIQDAINAARAQGGQLWLPPGTYQVNRQLVVDQVTIRGAGPWYTVLTGADVGVFGNPAPNPSTGVHLSDFAIIGTTKVRNDTTSDSGLGGSLSDSTVDNIWIEHTKVGMWFDGPSSGLTVRHSRIQDVWADGINLHDGVSNTVVENTFVRNTGDDGLAMWSDRAPDQHNTFQHNTVSVPVLANGLAIYGGTDNTITANVVADTVTQGGGIHIGNRFGAVPLAGTTTVSGDLLVRTGSLVPNDPVQIGAIWLWAADAPMDGTVDIHDERLVDSSFAGFQFVGRPITHVSVDRATILGAGSFAVQLQAPGAATFSYLTAARLGAAGVQDCNTGFVLTRGPGDLGWPGTTCGLPAAGQLQITQAKGIDFGFRAVATTTTLPIDITNPGPTPISVTALRPPDGFTADNSCPLIAVGATCTITVAFNPTASHNYSGRLVIESNSPAGPYVVGVNGIGYDPNGNLALGRTVTASSSCCFWLPPSNLVDGNQDTYFESADGTFPQTISVDLGQTITVSRIVLKLPANWGARTETVAVAADGTPLLPAANYTLDPSTGNTATLSFPATSLRTITLTVTANTGWPAAQFSEIEVYAH